MVVTNALNGLVLVLHFLGRSFGSNAKSGFRSAHPAGWLLLPFLGYAAINVQWISPVPWLGWRDWLGWAQMVAIFWVVLNGVTTSPTRAVLRWALIVLGLVAVALAVYQRFVNPSWLMLGRTQTHYFVGRASGPFGIPNSLAAWLIVVLPFLIAAAFRRRATPVSRICHGYLALVLAAGLVLTISRGAWLALTLGLVAWPVLRFRRSGQRRLAWSAGIGVALVALAAVLIWNLPAVRDRVVRLKADNGERSRRILWDAAWHMFREHPVTGTGGGSFNVLFDQRRPENFQDEPLWVHNDYLNTLSDYGAVGFALCFGAWGAIAWGCARRSRVVKSSDPANDQWWTSAATVGLGAFAIHLGVEFQLKVPALAMLVATMAGLIVPVYWPVAADQQRGLGKWLVGRSVIAALGVVLATIWFSQPIYRAEALRAEARQSVDRRISTSPSSEIRAEILQIAQRKLSRSVELDASNGSAWADLAYIKELRVAMSPTIEPQLTREALHAAERAIECSKVVPDFWIRRGVARSLGGPLPEAGSDFVRAIELAPRSASSWYYHAVYQAAVHEDPALAIASAAFCLRLDPGNREAQALLRRLTDRSRASNSSSHAPE